MLFSCSETAKKSKTNRKSGIECKILLSAGDLYPLFDNSPIPTFFNVGEIQDNSGNIHNSITLCDRKSKGSKISVEPIALFSFEMDTITHKYIISIPAQPSYISEFDNFLIKKYPLQNSLENWFKSQCEMGHCSNFKFENTYKALLQIN